MLALGTKAPSFELRNAVTDEFVKLKKIQGKKGTLVMFLCNHCPFVKHVNQGLVSLAQDYLPRQIGFVAISSNDIDNYPQDAPIFMKQVAEEEGYPFPYLYDETQEVARAYQASCTPDFFLFDASMKLVYRGQLDDSRPHNGIPVTGESLRSAIDALLEKKTIDPDQKPSLGCNIKWKE